MIDLVLSGPRLLLAWSEAQTQAVTAVIPRDWSSPSLREDIAIWAAAAVFVFVIRVVSIGMRRNGAFNERVLIVGSGPLIPALIDEIEQRPESPYVVIGVVDDSAGRPTPGLSPRLGSIARLRQIIDGTHPARIVLALSERRRVPDELLLDSRIHGVAVEEAINFYERVTGKLAIEALTPRSLVLSSGFRHSDFGPSDISMSLTRGLSFLCAAVGLVALSPLLALIAACVRLDSPGPVFFVQERIGRGGRPFGLLKFRTMRQPHAGQRSLWVRDNADRITRVGKWLRRFRLDELPQFLNVLRGEMNLVGPRPHPTANYQLFLERIPYYGLRSAVRPGITGWAQVRYGYANGLEEETEKMRYDLYYIKHRSLWLDLRILAETARVLTFDRRSHETVRRPPTSYWHEEWHGRASGAAS